MLRSAFLRATEASLAEARDAAGALVGHAVEVSPLITNGRNSRVWQVRSGDHAFALKQYATRQDEPRNRLATEVDALRLMERCQIDHVPRVLAVDDARGYALLSWIDGREVIAINDDDIDAAIAFLSVIHELRVSPWAAEQPLAAEACLSGLEIERQITERLARLRKAARREPEALDFVNQSFPFAFSKASAEARKQMAVASLDFTAELAQERRTLVPSDFGFHNCLRQNDGSLVFLDFEYFGWDDPVKLTADFVLHPGRALPVVQRRRFREAAVRLYGTDPAFARRLTAYLPLFGLRWVLILLNEFVPERWHQRVRAGYPGSWSDAKARQLARAQDFLASLQQTLED
jgi:fructosamine-3-kinase